MASHWPTQCGVAVAIVLATAFAFATESYASARSSCTDIGHEIAPDPNDGRLGAELMQAMRAGNWSLARGLLLLGATPADDTSARILRRLRKERTSAELIPASARGDLRAVLRLLEAGADPNADAAQDDFETPLAWAAQCEHPAVVRALIAHGADVNRRFIWNWTWLYDGDTALNLAVQAEARKSVAILLAHGANPNIRAKAYDPVARKSRGRDGTVLFGETDPAIRRMLIRAGAKSIPPDQRPTPRKAF